MKAVQIKNFGGPEVLETVTVEEPSVNDDEVKVILYTTGLNPNEAYTITGSYKSFQPKLPYTPGFDGAGIVQEVGEAVSNFSKGDRVWLSGFLANRNTGTYAEKVVINQEYVHLLPDNLPLLEAGGLGIPIFTAYRALFKRANIQEGETVLIHGASGAVGSLAVQMAKAVGATVIGTASTEAGRQTVLSLGANYVLDHITQKNKEELLEQTNHKGPDLIIEMLANENLEIDTEIIAKEGRIVVIGSRDSVEITPRNLMGTEATMTAVNVGRMTKEEKDEALVGIHAFLKNGSVHPLIGRQFTLDEASKAHQEMMGGSGAGRTVFVIQEE